MPTIFIAVQCCQCSTMQVKQQNKSGNKWTCAVCNQKQSVRKVFAQGFVAKDVRKFVQSFNMSRHFAEQQMDQGLFGGDEGREKQDPLPSQVQGFETQFSITDLKKRRTDWSEYIDPEDQPNYRVEGIQEESGAAGQVFDRKFVTELPKALFKKPKLKDTIALEIANGRCEKSPSRQSFGRRYSKKQTVLRGSQKSKFQLTVAREDHRWSYHKTSQTDKISVYNEPKRTRATAGLGTFKWNSYMKKDDDGNYANEVPWKLKPARKRETFQWDEYLTEVDDGMQLDSRRDMVNNLDHQNHGSFQTLLIDHRVEEDVHPDFQ